MTDRQSVTTQWARFARHLQIQHIPPATRGIGARVLAHTIANALSNAYRPHCEAAVDTLKAFELRGKSHVIGRTERLPPAWAALVAGTAAQSTSPAPESWQISAAAPIVAAALTIGELVDASTDDLLVSIIAAFEVTGRVDRGLNEHRRYDAWDPAGSVGRLGAAVAAATLLRLPESSWCHALAIASTQVAGLMSQEGTTMMPIHAGKAASDAVEAALLASQGFTGPGPAVEGIRGLAATISGEVDIEVMIHQMGTTWDTDLIDIEGAYAAPSDDGGYADFAARVRPILGDRTNELWSTATSTSGSITVRTLFALAEPTLARSPLRPLDSQSL